MSSTNPTLINGFEDVMAHIKKLEEENKQLKDKVTMYDDWVKDQKIARETLERQNKKIMEERMEAKRQFKQEIEMMQDSLNKAYASIESDVTVFEFIDHHLGAIQCNKEDIDNYTENQSARETLYSLADITLPEEDEE
jgi:predicted RNase H-like nuclease (RuvC/YqgF family)